MNPFGWQLDVESELLTGGDVILNTGCGRGKSVVFQLSLLLDEMSISLVMLPLSALMLEQVCLLYMAFNSFLFTPLFIISSGLKIEAKDSGCVFGDH